MVFWSLLAFMAALAVGLVLRPLLGQRRTATDRNSYEAAVYRDQLASLDKDLASGLIGEAEAIATRAEVGRRLLLISRATPESQSADSQVGQPPSYRMLAIVLMALLPVASIAGYLAVGAPGVSSVPYAARFEQNPESATLENLVAQIERHLRANPNDVKGWDIVGRPFMRLGRFRDAANAFDQAIKLDGPTAVRLASYGEALVFAANGMVEAQAREAFEKSLALQADYSQARYYLGLADFQARNFEKAIVIWQAMLDDDPVKAEWRTEVIEQVALAKRLLAGDAPGDAPNAAPGAATGATTSDQPVARAAPTPAPGPTAKDVEAAQSLTPQEQRALIEKMVARLADRLKTEGDDIDGWVRLVRAYEVLGQPDQAREALKRANEIFAGDPGKLERLRDLAPET